MSLRCVAADSIYANNANRKFSMQHVYIVDYQRFSILIGTNIFLTKNSFSMYKCKPLFFSLLLILFVPPFFIQILYIDAAYLHHWLSVTIHFNRYNLCFDKYTECRDKCKPLYFIALHIRVVPLLFSSFMECPLSDTRCWMIGHFRRYVTERLLNTKVVVFLEFLWFAVEFLLVWCNEIFDSLEKV